MTVGKTFPSSISRNELLSQFSETQILSTVFPDIKTLPCLICSPLRTDVHPSMGIYMSNSGHIYYKDYANSEEKGSLLDLLCKYWKCSFNQTINRICDMMVKPDEVTIKPKQVRVLTRKEHDELSKIQVAVRPWRDYDYQYWESYGVGKKWLHYAEVYPISHKIVTKRVDGKNYRYTFPAEEYAYVFVEHKKNKLSIKIYQPFSKKDKWCSKMDASVIGLWTKIPETGDKVIICSSLKDSLCMACQLGIPTLWLQSEGCGMSDTAVKELKKRYKKIYVSFDTDKAGIEGGRKLSERTGFIHIIPDLGEQKDYSDYYKNLKDKSLFKELKKLFI